MSKASTIRFSDELERWLKGSSAKTLQRLNSVFEERTFGVAFLLLLAIPALPLPTGGITHIFELIAMLLALELIIGRQTLWLPRKIGQQDMGKTLTKKVLPFLLRRIRWLEKYSRPRLSSLVGHRLFRSLAGLLLLISSLFAFIAPPFSGLDTIPALGGVLLALALILSDFAFFVGGMLLTALGVGLIIGLGFGSLEAFRHIIG